MIVVGRTPYKRVRDVVGGELIVRWNADGRYCAIVAPFPGGLTEYIVDRQGAASFRPVVAVRDSLGGECLSYGLDWVLELIPDDRTVIGNHPIWNFPGGIKDEGGSLIMNFYEDFARSRLLNLETMADVEVTTEQANKQGIGYGTWKIWANEGSKKAEEHPVASWPPVSH